MVLIKSFLAIQKSKGLTQLAHHISDLENCDVTVPSSNEDVLGVVMENENLEILLFDQSIAKLRRRKTSVFLTWLVICSFSYAIPLLSQQHNLLGQKKEGEVSAIPESFPEYDSRADSSMQYPITTPVKEKGKFEIFMLGEHHQDVYLEQYNYPVLDLSTYKGGLKVLKTGGGKQTNSLRLASHNEQEYVMRSITKDETRVVPYPFSKMAFVTYLFRDNYLGTFPFAPLVMPDLSDAANVYHANPGIYYIPKQPALGIHNQKFGGEVYLVEERASTEWPNLSSFGNATKFESTPDLAEKLVKNHKHKVDQNWVARSRIFDLLIGDFDRHDDQWRWTVTKTEDNLNIYRPIPRDRDQAFCKYDGNVIKLLSPYHALLRQLPDYNEPIKSFKWATFNTRFFDHTFINELSLEDWLKEAVFIQNNITDELIAKAFSKLPSRVYELSAPAIIKSLKERRDALPSIAEGLYRQLSKKVLITGTAKKEYFEVIRQDDEHTLVSVHAWSKKREKKELLYRRLFKTSETKEIYLYGLEDDDVFHISGEVNKGITLRIVGGLGKDEFIDKSKVKGRRKKDKFYDSKEGNILQLNSEGKDLTSDIAENNTYVRLGHQFDQNNFEPFPQVGYNADDGIMIGFSGIYQVSGFNKAPLGQQHELGLNYAFATQGMDFTYNGYFFGVKNYWDFVINTELRSNRYAFNFFGLGNESTQTVKELDFYRVRQSMAYLDFGWQRRFAEDIGAFSIRPLLQRTEIKSTENDFIASDDNGLSADNFENRLYAGLVTEFNFTKVDNEISPRTGYRFNTNLQWQTNLSGTDRRFTTLGTDFTIYKSFGGVHKLIFASRIGAELIRGNYDFFYAPTIGQEENLRGFYGQRYRGETSYFHTSDLRWELGSFSNPLIPFSFGITSSFDYGRVWQPNETSDFWHSSYGGGIFIMPLNLAVVTFNYNRSASDNWYTVSLGHAF